MGVTFKGGASGMREDYKAPTPNSGKDQPVLDTSTDGSVPSTVHLQAQIYAKDHVDFSTPDFMPTGGTIPEGSSDVGDQNATEGGWGPGVQTSKADYSGPGR